MAITTSKLTTLEQLRLQAVRIKTELDKKANSADLGALAELDEVAESNLASALKTKINGKADAADLGALAEKDEVAKSDLASALKTEIEGKADADDLGDLAALDEVAYANLATALKNLIDGKADAATTLAGYGITDGMTATEIETAIEEAIAASGHAHFEKIDHIPTVAEAQENVLYLYKNTSTGFYDIYAKVETSTPGTYEVVRLDDTSIDLTDYVTDDELTEAIANFITLTSLSVEVTGTGNAITAASYNNATGKFTFTKGATYLQESDVPVATDAEVTTMLNTVFGAAE